MKNQISRTQFATSESKELQRIRNSTSFRFTVLLTAAILNPLKLFILPYSVLRTLLRKPKPLHVHKTSS